MQNDLIGHLNGLLTNRLTAINQYFLHARMLKHSGEVTLADHEYKLSIEAMRHADLLVELVLSHGGAPNLQELERLRIGVSAEEMLANDEVLAQAAHVRINALVEGCGAAQANEVSELLAKIRVSLWEHADFISARAEISPQLKTVC